VSGLTATTLTTSSIYLSWNALSLNSDFGYSSITNYTIVWDQGSSINSWVNKTTSSNTYTTITGLSLGETYSFKIIANNIYGSGPITPTSSSDLVAAAPGQMNQVVITQSTTNVVFTWSSPNSTNGASIT
jgi:hypothetical protein